MKILYRVQLSEVDGKYSYVEDDSILHDDTKALKALLAMAQRISQHATERLTAVDDVELRQIED